MSLKRYLRAVHLVWALLATILRFGVMRLEGPMTPLRRAFWLQQCCQHVLESAGIRLYVQGTPPSRGMLVSNHLSYFDILAYSAAMPCVFVSKAEVNGWLYFGWAARTGGTIFLDRSSRSSAAHTAKEIQARMAGTVPVLLFPEGTSTDGSNVLRFHPTLFEPAVSTGAPITAAAIRYGVTEGARERDVCWFDDATLLRHLWSVLGLKSVQAEVSFAEPLVYPDRHTAAAQTHQQVAAMRTADVTPICQRTTPTMQDVASSIGRSS